MTHIKLTAVELKAFMDLHGFSDVEFASFLGVTLQAVRLWKGGERDISPTNTKIIRLFEKYPKLLKEF